MHLLGSANWWLPAWLERRLPHLSIEPPECRAAHERLAGVTVADLQEDDERDVRDIPG
jgi:RND superfamily putative drug exporter